MDKPSLLQPFGVIAKRGNLSFLRSGALVVYGLSRIEWFHACLTREGGSGFELVPVSPIDLFTSLDGGGGFMGTGRRVFSGYSASCDGAPRSSQWRSSLRF
jgi:hypothetical protein